jgi:hypothetical protein
MTLRQSQVTDEYGRPVPGAKIYVTAADDTAAVLTTSGAAPLPQPVITDEFGIYTYYADDGIYREDTWFAAKLRYREVIAIGDAEIHLFDLAKFWAAASASSAIAAAAAAAGGVIGGIALPRLTPELYGALGDGVADDGPALAACAAALSALGRGIIEFYPGRTYWVGSQTLNGALPADAGGGVGTFAPNTPYIMEVLNTTGPVAIRGNGARFKTLPGKKYGSFNEDGTARADASPYYGAGIAGLAQATPYIAMVYVKGASGPVEITDLELDGNIGAQVIGGPWGDTGIQIGMTGLLLRDNTGPIRTTNINSHHHGLDGGIGDGPGLRGVKESVVIHGRFANNGRQAFSLVGGNGWTFADGSEFIHSGKGIGGLAATLPAAGIDIEAEGGKYAINTKIGKVRIEDNAGVGLLVPSVAANSYGLDVDGAKIVGTTSYSIWPGRPYIRFRNCTILGQTQRIFPSTDPLQATQFYNCTFTDDVAQSESGLVYGGGSGVDLFDFGGGYQNIYFERCRIEKTKALPATLTAIGILPDANGDGSLHFHNCTFQKADAITGMTLGGLFSGPDTLFLNIQSHPDPGFVAAHPYLFNTGMALDSFQWEFHEGVALPQARYPATGDKQTLKKIYWGSAVYDPPSLAAGAKTGIQVMTVTGAVLGDKVDEVSFDKNLAGARIHAWVSAADTVSFYVVNENGANPLDLASGTVRVKVSQA